MPATGLLLVSSTVMAAAAAVADEADDVNVLDDGIDDEDESTGQHCRRAAVDIHPRLAARAASRNDILFIAELVKYIRTV